MKTNLMFLLSFLALTGLLLLNGCVRYAHNVNTLYEPTSAIHDGRGEIYIIIPENQQTRSKDIKWVFGNVMDDESNKIDEIIGSRSAAELIQTALGLELKKGGYTIIPTSKHHEGEKQVIDLTKTEIELEQVSTLTNLKAKCRVLLGADVFRNGQLIKRLQYESSSSNSDVMDRDLLANKVLEDTLQSVMLKAVPDMDILFKK